MSEEIHAQVSTFLDDELSGEECAFLVRRFDCDAGARAKFMRYCLIGATLRDELSHRDPDRLRRCVNDALNGTAAPLRPAIAPKPHWRRRVRTPALGIGMAASLAVISLFVVQTVDDATTPVGSAGALVASSSVPATGALVASNALPATQGGAVTPIMAAVAADNGVSQDVSVEDRSVDRSVRSVPQPMRLTNYLVHHGEYTSSLNRAWVYSTLVGGVDAAVINAVDSTAATSSGIVPTRASYTTGNDQDRQ